MNKPLLAAGALLLAGIGAAGAVVVASPGGEEEAVQEVATATQEPTVSAAPTQSVATSPTPSPSTVPEDWPTYSDPGGLFTVRYPANWFQSAGQAQFSSHDLSTLTTTSRPPEAISVEVVYGEAAGSNTCGGTLSVDPKSGQDLGPMPGAEPTTLGGVPAWELVRVQGDPSISEEDLTRIHRITVIHGGYCLFVTAYYTQQNPDTAIFVQIAGSFEFNF